VAVRSASFGVPPGADEHHEPRGIVTPEAVVLEFELANVGSRVLAQVVDLLVRLVALNVIAVLGGGILAGGGDASAVIFYVIAGFFIIFGYPVLAETMWNGQTFGKRVVGLRVVTIEGAPVRFRHAAIRGLISVVDFALPPVGVCATIAVLVSPRNQRLGDLFAGTIVLREKTGAAFPIPVSFPPLPGYEGYARTLDVGAVTPDQYALIRSFLIRVNVLLPGARARLAHGLANPVAAAMHHTPPAGVTAEAFLVSVAAAYQLRLGGPPVPLPPWVTQWGAPVPR
jgi:uncharacterized RDD family membrane protein YckC